MANSYFQFKQFLVRQDRCAMKVTTDACLFGAWVADKVRGIGIDCPGRRMLDIGTGTGLLSLMIAQKTGVYIDAVEIDSATAEQAAENINDSPWRDRVNVIRKDIKDLDISHSYDIIVSNPPFYENELPSDNTRKNVAHHDEGLLLRELLDVTSKNLTSDGRFYVMLPAKRVIDIGLLSRPRNLCITQITWIKQTTQHKPFRVFITGKHAMNGQEEDVKDEIAIRDKENNYTSGFLVLLKDYYLHL